MKQRIYGYEILNNEVHSPALRQLYGIYEFVNKIYLMLLLVGQILGGFPGEIGIVSTEVTESAQLAVDGSLEAELLDDHTRSEVEVLVDDDLEVVVSVAFSDGSVGVNVDGDGVGDTDTVSDLDEGSLGETSVDQTLGNPSGGISSGSVDLSWVLSGESTTSVTTPATVGIDDDLSSSKTSITAWASDNETA